MPRSILGKWLAIGNVNFDPLELVGEEEYGRRMVNEWIAILFLIKAAGELQSHIRELQNKSSLQRGKPALDGYYVSFYRDARHFILQVYPSPEDQQKKINVYDYLDRGNAPRGGGKKIFSSKEYGGKLRFQPRNINLTVASVKATPLQVNQGELNSGGAIVRNYVKPYKGRYLYRKAFAGAALWYTSMRQELANYVKTKTARQTDRIIRKRFRDVFKINFITTIPNSKRGFAFLWVDLSASDYLRKIPRNNPIETKVLQLNQ